MTGQAVSNREDPPADGVWTLANGQAIIAEPHGPATLLVPSESVRLLAVDLPLASHGKRLAALPFAIEAMIADPIEAVHIVLGEPIGPQRYLAAVVRHGQMAHWAEIADAAGLGHAAIVPDALALPRPDGGGWCALAGAGRVVVRSGDGTGFAVPSALIGAAWDAAGRPSIRNAGPAPIGELASAPLTDMIALADRLRAPAIDLRQGLYARRSAPARRWLKRFGWLAAAGIAAHVVIAAADTAMLRVIAERRAADTRAAVAIAAPGTNLSDDLQGSVADLLPASAPSGSAFVPLVVRTARALAPLSGAIRTRAMRFDGAALVLEIEPGAGVAAQVRDAMRAANIAADVAAAGDGSVIVTVRA